MAARVLVLGAGSGAGNNLIRSLRAGDLSPFIVGCHDDRFVLKGSSADRNYLIPATRRATFAPALRRVMRSAKVDLVIPTSDEDVRAISRLRNSLPCRVFLPRHATVELCQDKYRLVAFLRARRIPAPLTHPVTDPRRMGEVFRRVARGSRVWCRVRTGSGSAGALAVRSAAQARNWVRCWEETRGVAARSFTLAEYLPGRDFGCQGLWEDGRLILIKTYERLSYLGTGGQPGHVASVATLSKTVFEPRVVEICRDAIRALDPGASGAFSVDLKEDARGVPSITEVNAGRLSSATNIFDLTGKHNMAVTYVRLALGEPVDLYDEYDVVPDHYMVRDLDAVPRIHQADEFFERIREVWR